MHAKGGMSLSEYVWPAVNHVGDVYAQPGSVLETRVLDDYELVYFPDGTNTVYEVEGRPIALDRPGFLFTRPGELNRYRFDPDRSVRHLFTHFDYVCLRDGDPRFSTLLHKFDWLPISGSSLLPGLMKQTLRIAFYQSQHWKRRLSVLVAAMLEELCAAADNALEASSRPLPIPIAQAIAYMEERLGEPLTIEQIAQQSGWSHEHFTRMFVAAMGMTPKRALLERRLLWAEQLMLSGRLSLKQIAFKVGFLDEHHFSRTYKRIRGITASAYIERCKNPLYRHTAALIDPDSPFSDSYHVLVNDPIK